MHPSCRAFRLLAAFWMLAGLSTLCGAQELTVATLNARNYNCSDRRVDGEWRPAYPKPEAEKTAMRTVIHAVAPDVLLLQEIGPGPYLEELRRDLALEGLDYPHSAHLRAQDEQRCLALLSRLPLLEVHEFPDLRFTLDGREQSVRRGLLAVQVGMGERRLRIYTLHLKSRIGDDPADPDAARQRAGEAGAIRRAVEDCERGGPGLFIIAGDFNDVPGSAALRRLCTSAGEPFSIDTRPLDSRGEAWTYFHSPSDTWERVDYLLLSPALAAFMRPGDARIYDGPSALLGSDHRMISITLNLSDDLPKN